MGGQVLSQGQQVYYDANTGQYYTLNSPQSASNWGGAGGFMNPILRATGLGNYAQDRNYLGAVLGSVNNKSMVDENTARAKAAYEAVLSNLSSSPAYNQSAMFPGLSSPSDTQLSQAPMNMYGAGRFLSPAQGQQTGGVLGFNFNAPTTKA